MKYSNNNQFKKTIYYYTWNTQFPLLPLIIKDIKDNKPERIVFCDFEEYEYPWNYPELIDELNKLINKFNIEFIITLGSEKTNFFLDCFSSNIKCKNLHFPLFWLYKTYSHLDDMNAFSLHEEIYIDKLFISLNNLRREHRYLLMDKLCEYDLLNYGYISWLQFGDEIDYKLKCWKEKQIILDKKRIKTQEDQCNVPLEYKKVFVNIISESTTETLFLTEKTFISILLKQPFLILGSKNIHQLLKKYGFQLYDEIFDYSFDDLLVVEDRIDGIIKNLLKIKDKNYTHLRELIENKIQFNFNHAINIVENKLFIPDNIKDILNELNFNFERGISAKCLKGFLFQGYQKQKNINKII
jgi:hypothetical protein